jgi:hypothetical protein
VSIAAGGSATFRWTCTATVAGSYALRAAVTAKDALSGVDVAPVLGDLALIVGAPAATLDATTWEVTPATSVVNEDVDVTLTLTNTGGEDAAAASVTMVLPSIAPAETASCTSATPAASEGAPVSIAGGQSATFRWTCRMSFPGRYELNAAVTAKDASSGADVAPALPNRSVHVLLF